MFVSSHYGFVLLQRIWVELISCSILASNMISFNIRPRAEGTKPLDYALPRQVDFLGHALPATEDRYHSCPGLCDPSILSEKREFPFQTVSHGL